jgi:hypothetical protein
MVTIGSIQAIWEKSPAPNTHQKFAARSSAQASKPACAMRAPLPFRKDTTKAATTSRSSLQSSSPPLNPW